MPGVFIEAAGGDESVPGDDWILPKSPAVVGQFAFESGAGGVFFIPAVFSDGGDQVVRVILVIVYLCGFQPDVINADRSTQCLYVLDLMFIGSDDEELENDKRGFAVQFLFPLNDVSGTLDHFLQLSAHPILLIDVLGGAIDGNDQTIESAFHCSFRILMGQIMRIRGGGGINLFARCILHHVQKIRVEKGLSLKIEY